MAQLKVLKRRILWERDSHLLINAIALGIPAAIIILGVAYGCLSWAYDWMRGMRSPLTAVGVTDWTGLIGIAMVIAAPIGLFLFWKSPASTKDTSAKFEESTPEASAWVSRALDKKRSGSG